MPHEGLMIQLASWRWHIITDYLRELRQLI